MRWGAPARAPPPSERGSLGWGSSSDEDECYSRNRVATPWVSSSSQPPPPPDEHIPTTPNVQLPPCIQSPSASDADGSFTGFRRVDCPLGSALMMPAPCTLKTMGVGVTHGAPTSHVLQAGAPLSFLTCTTTMSRRPSCWIVRPSILRAPPSVRPAQPVSDRQAPDPLLEPGTRTWF